MITVNNQYFFLTCDSRSVIETALSVVSVSVLQTCIACFASIGKPSGASILLYARVGKVGH